MSSIDYSINEGTGSIVLRRERSINALSLEMIESLTNTLQNWAGDERINEVTIEGSGRGLCAGADVRQLRELALSNHDAAVEFLAKEYVLDALIASYPKPYTAFMRGIVMGGGMGISVHGSHRIVDPTTQMAMPETIIGLWPDVGMTYHLSRVSGEAGTFMALTGLTITGSQALAYGLADEEQAVGDQPSDAQSWDVSDDEWKKGAFAGDDPALIIGKLEADDRPAAREAAGAIRMRSPLSVCVTLEAVRRAEHMEIADVFAQDLRIGAFFLSRPDFIEGVRAQLIDKDHQPRWSHRRIEDVSRAEVQAAFE